MTAEAVLSDLLESGITPAVTADGLGIVVPAGKLTIAQREAIKHHKRELIAYLQESSRVTVALLEAAMRACDRWGDSPTAREQMRRDVMNADQKDRAAWLAHFRKEYP